MNLTIEIEDYLSAESIRGIIQDELKMAVRRFVSDEKNFYRIFSNLSYHFIYDEIDKVIPNSRDVIIKKTIDVLSDIKNYSVFRDERYCGNGYSQAMQIMIDSVQKNKDLINEKVKECIINADFTDEIWDEYIRMGENFIDSFYTIAQLGREIQNRKKDLLNE